MFPIESTFDLSCFSADPFYVKLTLTCTATSHAISELPNAVSACSRLRFPWCPRPSLCSQHRCAKTGYWIGGQVQTSGLRSAERLHDGAQLQQTCDASLMYPADRSGNPLSIPGPASANSSIEDEQLASESPRLRPAGVYGWLQLADIEIAVFDPTSSLLQRVISFHQFGPHGNAEEQCVGTPVILAQVRLIVAVGAKRFHFAEILFQSKGQRAPRREHHGC